MRQLFTPWTALGQPSECFWIEIEETENYGCFLRHSNLLRKYCRNLEKMFAAVGAGQACCHGDDEVPLITSVCRLLCKLRLIVQNKKINDKCGGNY